MYCIKCGVKLADTEKSCPLCLTRVYHPQLHQPAADPLFPQERFPRPGRASRSLPVALTVLWVISMLVVLLCDLQVNRKISWAGIVIGALAVGYVALVLPGWFRKPNPVIFVPCAFGAAIAYLLYICLVTGGRWFLGFAFPVTGGFGLIVTGFVTLMRYVPRGKLFITGGTMMAQGGFMVLVELLLCSTFDKVVFSGWSLYPLLALALLGGYLIFLGICRPAREAMERKMFF